MPIYPEVSQLPMWHQKELETINVTQPNNVKKLKDKCHYFAKRHRMILD